MITIYTYLATSALRIGIYICIYIYSSPFYLATAHSHCLIIIRRDGGLSTLCHSCGFSCQQRVLKTFLDPDYLLSEEGVVWLWYFLVNFRIYSSLFYLATAYSHCFKVIGRNGGLSTLCHSYDLSGEQKVLKTFPGPGYLRSENGVIWL